MTDAHNQGDVSEAVDMRSNRLRYHKNRAKKTVMKAEATLNQKMITNGFFLKFETAAILFYQAHISFKACSKWRDAGDALSRCASLHHVRLKAIPEAAMLFCEAGEVYEKVDKNDAIKNYRQAVSLYCDLGIFTIAGRLQRRLSQIHFELRHWEEAGDGFRKAADFLTSSPEQSDACLELSAECLIRCEEYQAAHDLYVLVAESCVQTNLRYFNARKKLLRAALCLMALPLESGDDKGQNKYLTVTLALEKFERIDCLWQCCREYNFLNNVIEAREKFDYDGFADHLYYWHTARRLDKIDVDLLRVVKAEIENHLERCERERKEAIREKERQTKRRLKLEKKRRALAERGLDPDSIGLGDIDDSDDDDIGLSSVPAGGSSVSGNGEGEGGTSATNGGESGSEEDDEEEDSSSDDDSEIELPDELKVKTTPPKERRKRVKKSGGK